MNTKLNNSQAKTKTPGRRRNKGRKKWFFFIIIL